MFGCGCDRDKTKRPMMGRIASMHADFVIITSDNPRGEEPNSIIQEIAAGITSGSAKIIKLVDRKDAIERALKMAKEDDIVPAETEKKRLENLEQFLIEHIVDSLMMNEKIDILNYIYSDEQIEKKLTNERIRFFGKMKK